MGIFGTDSIHSMTNLSGNRNIVAESSHESMSEGTAAIIYESEQNFTNLMKTVGIHELHHYSTTGGQQVVYEGGTLKNFFSKIREFFKKLGKKIKELFNKFIMQIDSWIRKDDAFVKKHRDKLLKIDTRGFKYQGYNFTTGAATTQQALTATSKYIADNEMKQMNVGPHSTPAKVKQQDGWVKSWKDKKNEHVESMRAVAIGKNGKLTTKEFDDELFKVFRDGNNEKIELTKISVPTVLGTISNFSEQKKAAEKSMEEIEKNINSIIKDLDKQEREIAKFDNKESSEQTQARAAAMRYVTELSGANKDRLAVIQKVHGSLMSSMKHENRQAKSICVRLIGYSPKSESAQYTGGNQFNVEFI